MPQVLAPRPFLAFWPVVVLAAELGGFGPGVVATVASVLCVHLMLGPSLSELDLHDWIGLTATGIFLAGGMAISVFIGGKRKIQSLQRLQAAAVAASEARYRSFFVAANVGKSVTLPTGEIDVNQAFCDMLGYSPDELRGKTWQELTPHEEIAAINELLAPLMRGDKNAARFEKRYLHKNSSHVWADVSATVQRDRDGSPLHFIVTVVDITDRKRAEKSVVESESRYRSLFENMNTGFVLFEIVQDSQGAPMDLEILAANEGFEATTGLNIRDAIGRRLTQVLPGIKRDAVDWIGTYGKVALTGEPRQFEQGSERLGFHYSISAFKAGPNQCAVTFNDITERKRAEQELREHIVLLRAAWRVARFSG